MDPDGKTSETDDSSKATGWSTVAAVKPWKNSRSNPKDWEISQTFFGLKKPDGPAFK